MADSKDKRKNYELNKEEYDKAEAKRLAEAKGRRIKRKRQRKIFTALFLILLVLSSLLIFIKTPLFEVDVITVSGNNLVSYEDIVSSSGTNLGDNIFNHTASFIERQIIKLPYISKVEVKKKYPSEIVIEVVEEDVFGVLQFMDKKIAFDKFGKSIKELTDEEAENILTVRGIEEGTFKLGEYVDFLDKSKREIFERCLRYIVDYDIENVSLIDIEDTKDIYMVVGRGLKVKIGSLGTEDEFSYKMAYIKEVMANLPRNVSGVIDATNIESGVSYRTEEAEREETEEEKPMEEGEVEEKTEENSQ